MKKILLFLVGLTLSQAHGETAPLEVGVTAMDITPPRGVPLAGYGSPRRRLIPFDVFHLYPYAHFFKPSRGELDPIRSKVMYLKRGEQKLLFISLDLIGVTGDMREDVARRLKTFGFSSDDIFISGTHTHSGPGTLTQNPVWQKLVVDRFEPKIYEEVVSRVVTSVEKAMVLAEPADLFHVSFDAKGLQQNRRVKNGPVDSRAQLLLAKNKKGAWLGGIANLAIHGTALPASHLKYSADVPGGIERHLEELLASENPSGSDLPAMVFINGAEGDVAPVGEGESAIRTIGTQFSEQAKAALAHARSIQPNWRVRSGSAALGKARINIDMCIKMNLFSLLGKKVPFVSLAKYFPRYARVWQIELGDLLLATWPGEPTTSLGLALKDSATKHGYRDSLVLGLTNNYLAYFVEPREYVVGSYEACSALYGPLGGRRVIEAHRKILGE